MSWPKLAQWKGAADAARDWAAILYIPVLSGYAAWLTWLIAFGGWSAASERQRLSYLGFALIGALGLIGIGTLFLQRRNAKVKAEGPFGKIDFTSGDGDDAAAAAAGAAQVVAAQPTPPPAPPAAPVVATPPPQVPTP